MTIAVRAGTALLLTLLLTLAGQADEARPQADQGGQPTARPELSLGGQDAGVIQRDAAAGDPELLRKKRKKPSFQTRFFAE